MDMNETLFTMTESASSKLHDLMTKEKGKTTGLRVAVARTHCMGGRGYSYKFTFDSPIEGDEVAEHSGIKIFMDQASAQFLRAGELDYIDTLEGTGFKINNPNAVSKCPCGHHDLFE